MIEERTCPVCESNDWKVIIESQSGRIMTGDQRIGPGKLHKIICNKCGVAANKNKYSKTELETLYGNDYELNTYGREEHVFYTSNGPISRSQVFCDWISKHIPENTADLIEIGCGEGMLLSKLSQARPNVSMQGIDGSEKAVELARQKGLSVQQKLILNGNDKLPSTDCILLINVIEHIEDIEEVIDVLKNELNENGRIIFCLPIQDFGGYDIVFAEHVWHFTVNHFRRILQKNGLSIEFFDAEHPINHGIGLFVCSIGNQAIIPFKNQSEVISKSWSKWQSAFIDVEYYLENLGDERIAIFGSGEVLTMFMTFTKLGDSKIEFIIDETPSKQGTLKHGIQILNLDFLNTSEVENILVTTNPKYNEIICKKLEPFNVKAKFIGIT